MTLQAFFKHKTLFDEFGVFTRYKENVFYAKFAYFSIYHRYYPILEEMIHDEYKSDEDTDYAKESASAIDGRNGTESTLMDIENINID
jgi:hypothetical protein